MKKSKEEEAADAWARWQEACKSPKHTHKKPCENCPWSRPFVLTGK